MPDVTELAQGRDNAKGRDKSQWNGHRVAAVVLRVIVFLCPLSVAAFLGLLVSRSLPGATVTQLVTRAVITAVVALCAFIVVERLARRFLPLAALLRLNLVFPDRAPSRFSVALRSTSVRKLQQWVREARESEDVTVLAEKVVTLASALNTHDRRTRGHCERTRALADLIVEELHLSPAEANEVRWGAFLHDIGKLVVPPEILNKPGKPTTREWEVLRSHPEAGARLVEPLRGFLRSGVDAVGSHHENYDGTGYPAGVGGEHLSLAARIVSVADAFEVMTAVRAYQRPMTLQSARAELARRSGTQFDPHVVRAFLNVSLGRVHWTLGIAAWVAELPFLTFLPRVAAQVSATAGAPIAPVALPSVAAASLGAMAVLGHADRPPHSHATPLAHAAAPRSAAAPGPKATTSSTRVTASPQTPDPLSPTGPGSWPAVSDLSSALSHLVPKGGASPPTTGPGAATTGVAGAVRSLPGAATAGQAVAPVSVALGTVLGARPVTTAGGNVATVVPSTVRSLIADADAVTDVAGLGGLQTPLP